MSNFWVKLKKPFIVLAPMEGVTDYVFRDIISDVAKPDVLFTEFTNAESLSSLGYEKTVTRLAYSEKQRPIVAQIWGVKPEKISLATKIVKDMGFDGIDINMGCPDKAVVKKGGGAGLINDPVLASEIIFAIKESKGDMPISVKTRLGFNEKITDVWISHLLNLGIDALTIHARTAKELSKAKADWGEIHKAVLIRNEIAPNTLILGNGDVKTYKAALQRVDQYKVDGVMIGRGIFSNPFLFEKMPVTHSIKENLDLLLRHSEFFSTYYSNRRNFAEMRRFFKIYIKSFRGATALKLKLMEAENFEQVKEIISGFVIPTQN